MDIISGFEPEGVGSIPAGPAIPAVVQWIERGPPKSQIQVRFLSVGPNCCCVVVVGKKMKEVNDVYSKMERFGR